VVEELRRERQEALRSQGDGLATQMASVHHQKAERRTKVLETSRAMLALHGLLLQQLRDAESPESPELARSVQNHCLVGLRPATSPASSGSKHFIAVT